MNSLLRDSAVFAVSSIAMSACCGSALAATVDISRVCNIASTADVALRVHVQSGEEACRKEFCFATIYTAEVRKSPGEEGNTHPMPIEDESPEYVRFVTSGSVQIGVDYLIFANRLEPGEKIAYRSGGGESTYEVPASVSLYVPINAVFQSSGKRHFRTVPSFCFGDGPDCIRIDQSKGVVLAAVVEYPRLIEELSSCDHAKFRDVISPAVDKPAADR